MSEVLAQEGIDQHLGAGVAGRKLLEVMEIGTPNRSPNGDLPLLMLACGVPDREKRSHTHLSGRVCQRHQNTGPKSISTPRLDLRSYSFLSLCRRCWRSWAFCPLAERCSWCSFQAPDTFSRRKPQKPYELCPPPDKPYPFWPYKLPEPFQLFRAYEHEKPFTPPQALERFWAPRTRASNPKPPKPPTPYTPDPKAPKSWGLGLVFLWRPAPSLRGRAGRNSRALAPQPSGLGFRV